MLYNYTDDDKTVEIDDGDLENPDAIICYLLIVVIHKVKNRSKPPKMDLNDIPKDITDDKKRWLYILSEIEWTCFHIAYKANKENYIIKDNILDLMKYEDRVQNGLRLLAKYLRDIKL